MAEGKDKSLKSFVSKNCNGNKINVKTNERFKSVKALLNENKA